MPFVGASWGELCGLYDLYSFYAKKEISSHRVKIVHPWWGICGRIPMGVWCNDGLHYAICCGAGIGAQGSTEEYEMMSRIVMSCEGWCYGMLIAAVTGGVEWGCIWTNRLNERNS